MSEYDSILKEKKKTSSETTAQDKKSFPTFSLSLIATIIIIVVSYTVYYNTILAKDQIIINNLSILKEQYKNIIDNLYIDSFSSDNIEGQITINDTNNYSFIKDDNNYYLNINGLNNYINNSYQGSFNLNLEYLTTLNEDRYIKSFYLNDTTPIVEANLILSRTDLENLLGMTFMNEYEAIITCQNHAVTNEILNIKIVINDKITSARKVITFENNTIYYKDSTNDLRFDIILKNNDFNIKIYKSDILYSVITGTEKINTYNYSYQIIDKLYTLNLTTRIEEGKYIYDFSSSIDSVNSYATLIISELSNNLFEIVDYQELSDQDKIIYDNEKNILLKFINKYKNNI